MSQTYVVRRVTLRSWLTENCPVGVSEDMGKGLCTGWWKCFFNLQREFASPQDSTLVNLRAALRESE